MKKFSEFAKSGYNLPGEKMSLDRVMGKTIVVKAFRTMESKYREGRTCTQIQFMYNEEERITFTTSGVLLSQLKQYEAELPFEATIKKEGKYFTFS